jgi:acetylglutamate kinase
MAEPLNPTPQQQSEILMQALPHMLRYDDAIVVVKYGGHAMGDEDKARDFAKDMVLLEQSGINPVVVHGGGPQIGMMLKKLGIESHFSGGLRVTDKPTMEIVEMVLAGSINKQIVGSINAEGGRAVGLCGKDGNMVTARKVHRPHGPGEDVVDLGFVGEPDKVDATVLEQILGRELIPVLAPVAQGPDGQTYNVNADTFAGAVAGALGAKRLLFLTDVPGVLDKNKGLIKELRVDDIRGLDLHLCAGEGRRRRRDPGRQGPPCGADRASDRLWRGNAHHAIAGLQGGRECVFLRSTRLVEQRRSRS